MNNEAESTTKGGDEEHITPIPDDEGEFAPRIGDEDDSMPLFGDEDEGAPLLGDEGERITRRSDARRFAALVLITAATFIAAGHTLRQPAFMTANDISRWCTVWSLLERRTYVIDDCPWQIDTQDKIYGVPKKRGGADQGEEAVKHYYSSKPALLSTLIAGMLYPARKISGVPLHREVTQPREPRQTQKPDPKKPGELMGVLETPKDPVKWPAYGFYFKPTLLVLNVLPYALFLIFFARRSTATRPTTGRGSSAWSPRRSARICCRTPRR